MLADNNCKPYCKLLKHWLFLSIKKQKAVFLTHICLQFMTLHNLTRCWLETSVYLIYIPSDQFKVMEFSKTPDFMHLPSLTVDTTKWTSIQHNSDDMHFKN